jgi:Family of unknown function (DUF5824)
MLDTYKHRFNRKYGFPPETSHTIAEISKLTGYKKSGLDIILEKGRGAFFSNPQSVRPQVHDPTHWGMSRIYSAVMGGKAARVDAAHLQRVSTK